MLLYRSAYFMPNLNEDNNRIFCISTHPKPKDINYSASLLITLILSIMDLQLNVEAIHGSIILIDLEHSQLSQFLAFTPTLTKTAVTCCIVSTECIVADIVWNNVMLLLYVSFYVLRYECIWNARSVGWKNNWVHWCRMIMQSRRPL